MKSGQVLWLRGKYHRSVKAAAMALGSMKPSKSSSTNSSTTFRMSRYSFWMSRYSSWISIYYRPRRVRRSKRLGWFGGAIVAVIVGVVVLYLVYLVFLPVADHIAEHDVGTITGP